MSITQQKLEAWLWGAANILRGPVDPANLREFVFPLLFLKRLSDTWDEEQATAVDAFGEDVHVEVAADFHTFEIPDGCHWNDLRRVTENHGFELQKIMQSIEAANPDKLAQIFGNAPWANPERMPPDRLERLIEHFGQKYLGYSAVSNDLLGRGYEYLLKRFSDESATSAGQHFTPREVVHLLIRILDPKPTDTVYDPACGSAGMLIEAANEVVASGGSVAQMRFYGQEINQTSASIGRVNLLIHSLEDATVLRGDTLRNPKFIDSTGKLERFDVILANPPFSLKEWGSDTWATDPHRRAMGGVPPDSKGDLAWVQHMIASMTPETGRVGVVMPHGVLFRGQVEARIRKHLIESDLLEAVIGLAPNLFYGTPIAACLLIFRATKPKERINHVLLVDGQTHFVKGSNQNELSEANVADLHGAYKDPDTSPATVARLVHISEIERNDWDLTVGRYLESNGVEIVDVATALAHLEEAQHALAAAEAAMLTRLKEAGYADNDGLQARVDSGRGGHSTLLQDLLTPGKDCSWIERSLGELLSLEYGKALKKGNRDGKGFPVYGSAGVIGHHSNPNVSHPDVEQGPVIIVGRKGTVGAVHWSSSPCSVIDTAYFVVPRTDDSYRFLYLLLQYADLPSLSAQTGVPGLNRERVYQTVIHVPPLAEQRRIVDVMDSVDILITDCGAARERAAEVRSGLLSELLSGRHRIPPSYDRFLSDK